MMNKFQIKGLNAKVLKNLLQAHIRRQSYPVNIYFVIFMISTSKTFATQQKKKLTNCVQLHANKKIRTLPKRRNKTNKIAIASDKLIAKYIVYHFMLQKLHQVS